MAEFKVPDPKKTSGKVMGLLLLAGVGLLAWSYVVPFLATVVWNTVSLAIGCGVVGILGMILLSKKFWKRLNIILQALGTMIFGAFIEMNPFTILELQLEQSEKDRAELFKQKGKLEAQKSKLDSQLSEEQSTMELAAEKMELCKQKIQSNPSDQTLSLDLQSASVDWSNSKDFIDKVAPIAGDISRLVAHAEKAYVQSGYALKNAKSTLSKQRAAYDAVTAGSNAMSRALKAFTGDPEMNNAAGIALRKLQTDIADKVGTIKNCIAETSKLMNERDLNDAAKVSLAVKNMEQLGIDQKFDSGYVSQIGQTGNIALPAANKWVDTLKQK